MRNPLQYAAAIFVARPGLRRGFFGSLKTRLRWSYAMVSVVPLVLLGVVLIGFILQGQRRAVAQQQQIAANWVARMRRSSRPAWP